MNLLALRKKFVDQCGYRALVTDYPNADYSDNGADYFINEGLKWLERRWSNTGSYRRYQATLHAGDYTTTIPHLEFAKRIDVRDADGILALREVSIEWLREAYGETFGGVEQATPAWWALNPPDTTQQFATSIVDGSFYYGPNGWEASLGTLGWRGTSLRMTVPVAGVAAMQFDFGVPTDLTGYTLSFTATESNAAGTFTVSIVSNGVTTTFATGTSPFVLDTLLLALYDAGSSYTLAELQAFLAAVDTIKVNYTATSADYVDISSLSLTPSTTKQEGNVVIMPPADGTYSVSVYGTFKSEDLSGDSDTNWWTDNQPALLIRAARIQLELDGHRNISGVKAFQEQVEEELARIASENQFAYISSLTPTEFVPNG